MISRNEVHVVYGVRSDGKRLRPSDWIERLSSTFATFGDDRRLCYAHGVNPGVLNGEPVLIIANQFAQANPSAYAYIMDFVTSNHLKMQSAFN